ncbi:MULTISPECIES: ribokinase [unclassified Streptomyces]|uniref:ribokinase n=1 Tax=unclassified Streptomyces TaxID=2593676 RepID=UPI0022B631FA|nr:MULTISPECIES: ribokinase [unclassified Streptomyces]MCZ7414392.1 ribokinase [Streptomyces sp. WMMC897]MCZ7431347.1 ribokinase [Streptomyces sp. WMMC1477]
MTAPGPAADTPGTGLDVLVIGSANADLVTVVERHPTPGETVLGSDLALHPGGKGANQAVAAARLGARAGLLARVGDDAHGRLLADSLAASGVATGTLLTGGAPTGVALITVGPGGDNTIVVSPGANGHLTPADVAAAQDAVGAAAVVSLQLEIPLETVAAAVYTAAAAGTRVVLNPSPPAALPPDVLALCDPLVVNEHEARLLLAGTGAADGGTPADWAAALLRHGPRSVVVTLGAAGALARGPEGTALVPAPRVEAVDSTGAGDAFTGALAWRLARGDGLATAVRFAVRAGAASVAQPGAQSSYPSPGELP